MVYCESKGMNCFWVRNDLIKLHMKVLPESAQNFLTTKQLYRNSAAKYPKHDETKTPWFQVIC